MNNSCTSYCFGGVMIRA